MSPRRPTLLAPDRVRLYLALVPYLAERGEVTVAEAAADFDVTAEQMRAMVRRLTVIGLPGDDGYWQLDQDLFDINWDLLDSDDVIELTNTVALHRAPRLTAREAAALLSGLRMAQSVPGVDDRGVIAGLITKLARGASQAPADVVVAPPVPDAVRSVIAEAMRSGHAVEFTYRALDASPMRRTVDPLTVHVTSGEWYLQGWCHLRQAMRTFQLERVSDPTVTDLPVTHGADSLPDLFDVTGDDAAVTVRYRTDIAPLLGDYLRDADITTVGGISTAVLRLGDIRAIKRPATRRGGAVEVIAPESARQSTLEWARAGLEQYGTAAS